MQHLSLPSFPQHFRLLSFYHSLFTYTASRQSSSIWFTPRTSQGRILHSHEWQPSLLILNPSGHGCMHITSGHAAGSTKQTQTHLFYTLPGFTTSSHLYTESLHLRLRWLSAYIRCLNWYDGLVITIYTKSNVTKMPSATRCENASHQPQENHFTMFHIPQEPEFI